MSRGRLLSKKRWVFHGLDFKFLVLVDLFLTMGLILFSDFFCILDWSFNGGVEEG